MTHSADDVRAEWLFKAFVAGFKLSGEGWNGEYPYADTNTDPSNALRPMFCEWLALNDGGGADA